MCPQNGYLCSKILRHMSALRYPIGMQSFGKIRQGGFVYVDKTRHVYELAHGGSCYFLSRPRRFGKSLLLSTLKAYFLGQRELFEGLAIADMEEEWERHPVFHLDLANHNFKQAGELGLAIEAFLAKAEVAYGKDEHEATFGDRFRGVLQRANARSGGKGCVVLVDEYDKPILDLLGHPLEEVHRDILKGLYSTFKSADDSLRFVMLAGVSRFGKLSVFSGLNNLKDISLLPQYADICGISEQELQTVFAPSIRELAAANAITYEQACAQLRGKYDGYHFAVGSVGVYNPFSLLNAFCDHVLGDYWFETATPSSLIQLLKRTHCDLGRLAHEEQQAGTLSSMDLYEENPVPMLYQSGYLTIKGYDSRFGRYRLGFPNEEVEHGFIRQLLPAFLPQRRNAPFDLPQFVHDVETGNPEQFMQRLQAFFANVDHKVVGDMELYFQNALFLVFTLLGFYTQVERHTSHGSIDILLLTPGHIYIIECKLDKTAEVALRQINERGYAAPFAADSRPLHKIGVNFSSQTRGIDDYIIEDN